MSRLTLVVAATRTNGIGQNGGLPWRLPKEMAYFARITSDAPTDAQNAVIMGRNTWESIPDRFRPLRRRVNAVVSRNAAYPLSSAEGAPVLLSTSIHDALTKLRNLRADGKRVHRQFLIGGASLYTECLALAPDAEAFVDRVLLTRIVKPAFEDCDVFLHDFLHDGGWLRAGHEDLRSWVGWEVPEGEQEEKGVRYEFQMWVRTGTA